MAKRRLAARTASRSRQLTRPERHFEGMDHQLQSAGNTGMTNALRPVPKMG